MVRLYACVTEQHDLRLVLVAGVICLLASYTAFSLTARVRPGDRSAIAWLAAAAFVTGSGVWATHFVAMLAFRPGIPVNYDFGLTALSVVIAVIVSGCGWFAAIFRGQRVLGGALIGAAVGAMHYTGMAALLVPATKHWDMHYAHASLAIGLVVGALAITVGLRRDSLRARLGGASLLALAICGLHFTAMTALELRLDPTVAFSREVMAPDLLAVVVAAITLLIVALGFAGSMFDQHLAQRAAQEAERLRQYVAELEVTKRELEARTAEVTAALEEAAAGSQAKSQFLAAMSHELRTPLNAILGFAEMQMNQLFGPMGDPRYLDYANDIHSSGSHLLGLINDVLDFSKLDGGHLELYEEPVDLPSLIAESVHMMERQGEKAKVRLVVTQGPDFPLVQADERRLRQVLLNLLSNAVKFTPEGGEVTVSAAHVEGGVAITVADTGIGMEPEQIPTALDRFGQIDSRLSRKYEGTGLGLPLSKRLVELHGGTLDIDSVVGVGTTVTVRLPATRLLEQISAA